MLKRMRRIGLFVLAIAVVISSAIIASANERSGTNGSATTQSTASSYVIENKSSDKKDIVVTIEHYYIDKTDNKEKKLYSADQKKLSYGAKINDYAKATNWSVIDNRVEVILNDKKVTDFNANQIDLTESGTATIKVVYEEKKLSDVEGDATFYDYKVRAQKDDSIPNNNYSINAYSNYKNDGRNKLVSGTNNQNYQENQQNWTTTGLDMATGKPGQYNPNAYNKKVAIKGLISGLDKNGNVVFSCDEPGFFTNDEPTYKVWAGGTWDNPIYKDKYLKKVYTNYVLNFTRIGDTFNLANTRNIDTNKTCSSGDKFFPLDDVDEENYKDDGAYSINHNYFFGMRYDVQFKLGDYIGPLHYSFSGDDDLWVLLDGKVVIDLGGIHDALSEDVDLWNYIDVNDKEKMHTLTVLYMERGANASNCTMNFTIPNAKVVDVTEKPKAAINIQKVDEEGNGLDKATFKLVNDITKEERRINSTNDGNITFGNLVEGTYTLTESSAPDKYMISDNVWKVKVIKTSDTTAIAKLYLVQDNQEVEVTPGDDGKYKIENKKIQEIIENVLEYNKTAKVNNWDDRTYDINITAKSLSTSSTVVQREATADIMMVLDTSGSMLYNGNSGTDERGLKSVGQYKNVKNTLDVNKVYYYGNSFNSVQYSQWSYKNAKQPMIYMDNKWKYYNGSSWNDVPDQISSGWYTIDNNTTIYSLDSGLTGLKEASAAFISATAESSENSRIGVSTFNFNGTKLSDLVNAKENKNNLIKKTSSIYASGGTSPQEGLKIAKNSLASSKRTDVPQYVILFTDGDPSTNTDEASSETVAQELKDAGIIVYTVGLKLNDNTSSWLANKIATPNCAFTAANVDELKQIFAKIQQTISQNLDIKNASIVDVIDQRFQLVGNDGKVITDETLKDHEIQIATTNGKVGTAYYDETNKTQAIKWLDQTIPNTNTGEWNTTITVKAREEYIGGNNVPTNVSPDSKITTGFGEEILPQPKVNVKVDLAISNDDIWIDSGSTVPVDDTKTGNKAVYDVTRVRNNKDNIVKKYDESTKAFKDIELSDLTIQWFKDADCKTPISKEEIAKVQPDGRTDFYLKVGYNGGESTDESNANTNGYKVGVFNDKENNISYAVNDGEHGNDEECKKEFGGYKDKSEYGIYRIHVKYTLPETGGRGVYWYTAGGMLLMMVAAVVVYIKRYNEYMNK